MRVGYEDPAVLAEVLRLGAPDRLRLGHGVVLGEVRHPPPYSWTTAPAEDFTLSNNRASIKRLKERVGQLRKLADTPHTEREGNGVTIPEDPDANRIRIVFDDPDVRRRVEPKLKSRGIPLGPVRRRLAEATQQLRTVRGGGYVQAEGLLGEGE